MPPEFVSAATLLPYDVISSIAYGGHLFGRRDESRLEFAGVQAGAEFKGVFHKFTATVDLDPDALATARIEFRSS